MAVLATTSKKRTAWIEWLDHCRNGAFVNQLFFGKTIGGVPEPWADAIVALEMAFRAGVYTPKSAWSYNFRGIGGATCTCSNTSRCSLHSHGIAIDIDPRLNPFITTRIFRWSDTAFTPEQIALVEGIRNTKGEQLWFWAGRWKSIKDYMHFEANVDPGSADVDWTTVPGGIGDDDMNARKIIDLITAPELEKLRLAGRWAGETAYYYDGRSDAVAGANENLVDHLIASDQVASLETGGGAVDAYSKAESDGRFVNIGEGVKIVK